MHIGSALAERGDVRLGNGKGANVSVFERGEPGERFLSRGNIQRAGAFQRGLFRR